MVAALRLNNMSIQHVGRQGVRVTVSTKMYFRFSVKLFRGVMACENHRAPQNLRSIRQHLMNSTCRCSLTLGKSGKVCLTRWAGFSTISLLVNHGLLVVVWSTCVTVLEVLLLTAATSLYFFRRPVVEIHKYQWTGSTKTEVCSLVPNYPTCTGNRDYPKSYNPGAG